MRLASSVLTFIVVVLFSLVSFAQEPSASVPRLINITGVFRPADGQPPAAVETVTLAIYADSQGGTPLWQETQTVTIDDRGRYSLLLGATQAGGIPPAIFGSGEAHWLGTRFERPAEVEGPRVRLTSVPYAMRAAEADTLGGHPASDYVLATGASGDGKSAASTTATRSDVAGPAGTANFLPKYIDGVNFSDSALYESGGQVGLGTTTPFDMFHVRFTNTGGNFTGLAVQNLGNTATSYSGMLFFDQNNQLGQFQGFNNVTHEYRINNIAKNGASQLDGSINFMIGSASKFFVGSNGNIGIGTTAPATNLEVSNALSPAATTTATLTTYFNGFGSNSILARRARGTAAAPAALQAFDTLLELNTRGYGATGFGPTGVALISMGTSQNWTDTAQGTQISFATTANNSTTPGTRMIISNSGSVGIGTFSPVSNLEVSNALSGTTSGQVTTSTFNNSGAGSLFVGSRARGTSAAPTAVQAGDILGGFLGRGYGATNFSGTRGGMFVSASENWTDTAQGTRLNFNTTVNGTTAPGTRMTIDNVGNVGIGTLVPAGALEIARNGDSVVSIDAFGTDVLPGVALRAARGTQAAPTAIQRGDALGILATGGWDGVGFADGEAGLIGYAAENWTTTTRGAGLGFFTTPIGLPEDPTDLPNMVIIPGGNVGIGTPADVNGLPTATDKLQVFGDVRVGTSGTNGCVKRFDGTALAGTCSSDRRFKKDITPFAPVLGQLTALQPVHYYWRAEDFPDRHFGASRSYGLIAQDVEQVLPELIATDGDGYKAIDYSKLPLLTIQAVKELKAENDALKEQVAALKQQVENDPLNQRVAELERLIEELLAVKK
jgi:hypothetical protein